MEECRDAANALLEPLEARRFGLRRPDLVRHPLELELVVAEARFVRGYFIGRAALDGRQPSEMFFNLL